MHDTNLFAEKRRPNETTLHVLVVDDNLPNRTLATRMLLRAFNLIGLKVVIDQAENGLDAVNKVNEHLKSHHQNYDFILMDNEMPKKKGTEATLEIRLKERESNIASNDCSYIASWSATHTEQFEGADTSLEKPLKTANLAQAVQEMLSQKFQDTPSPPTKPT